MLINNKQIFLDIAVKNQDEAFKFIADQAFKLKITNDVDALINGLKNRELEGTTGFEDGFAIPHARIEQILKPAVLCVRFKKAINWNSLDSKPTKVAIVLLVPSNKESDNHMDMLSDVAIKMMEKEFRKTLKTSTDAKAILMAFKPNEQITLSPSIGKTERISAYKKYKIVGVTACPTGVAHTYMAREALVNTANESEFEVKIETQGQKGQEFILTDDDIIQADAVILATDITVDIDRFANKKIYYTSTKQALTNPLQELKKCLSESVMSNTSDFNTKKPKNNIGKQTWVTHIMAGISYMIPFIVFAGLTSAIIAGIVNAAGIKLNSNGSGVEKLLWHLNEFANIGFSVMMAIAGAYIANSIAGRAAIAPAFILTMIGNNPKLVWQGYFENIMVPGIDQDGNDIVQSINATMQPLNIFGAILFGLAVGYFVRWVNTSWKIHKHIQPIMPIIIIPLFVTLTFGIIYMFTLGPVLGVAVGYLYTGIFLVEKSGVGMALVGLLLGLLAGVDMGGPINKIASFGATALIPIDKGLAMGAAAAAFAIAPLGAGLATFIFPKTFKDDKEMGINAVSLGIMGVSESAIPYAVKYKWAAIIPNIVCSGIAGMFAGIFMVQGHVGAWGGPIIAIFAGVTDKNGSFIGIPLYLLAIMIGTICHILLFRIMVELQKTGKLNGDSFKEIFSRKPKVVKREE